MATDNTPPRLKLIATIAVITVITLIGIDFVLQSYFAMMTDEAQRVKLAPTTEREELHKAEQAALTNAAVPLDRAIAEIGKAERPAMIAPEQSEDLGPMTGWTKLPKPAPTPQQWAPATEDAGVQGAADAAATGAPAPADDAGASVPTPADAGLPLHQH